VIDERVEVQTAGPFPFGGMARRARIFFGHQTRRGVEDAHEYRYVVAGRHRWIRVLAAQKQRRGHVIPQPNCRFRVNQYDDEKYDDEAHYRHNYETSVRLRLHPLSLRIPPNSRITRPDDIHKSEVACRSTPNSANAKSSAVVWNRTHVRKFGSDLFSIYPSP
jgi:hypothetical protein